MTPLTQAMIDSFPVAGVHEHLPGCISAATALKLGLKNNLVRIEDGKIVPKGPDQNYSGYHANYASIFDVSSVPDESNGFAGVRYHKFSCFDDFDDVMAIVQGHRYAAPGGIQTLDDLKLALLDYLPYCQQNNIVYSELQQNIYIARSIFQIKDFTSDGRSFSARMGVYGVLKEMQELFKSHGITLNFVNCYNKSFTVSGPKEAREMAINAAIWLTEAGAEYPGLFAGINSAGNERKPLAHPRFHRHAYAIARENGFKADGHAGEAKGPCMIKASLEHLGLDVIGHGFRIVESPRMMDRVNERGTVIVSMPAMNMALGAKMRVNGPRKDKEYLNNIWQHPFFPMLRRYKMKVALATDNPLMGGVPFKQMLTQLSGLDPVIGKPPQGMNALSLEELFQCGMNTASAIHDDTNRLKYEIELNSWAIECRLDPLTVGEMAGKNHRYAILRRSAIAPSLRT